MNTNPPVVSLLSCKLIRLVLDMEHGASVHEGQVMLECKIAEPAPDSPVRVMRLHVKTTPPSGETSVPSVDAEIEGQFHVHSKDHDEHYALRVFGGAHLYALLRGMLSATASLFSNAAPVVLPTVNMMGLMGEAKPKKPKPAVPKKRKSKEHRS